jgi:hypothetical protein
VGFAEDVIDSVDWGAFGVCGKTGGEELAPALRAFINGTDGEELRRLWFGIEHVAFADSEIYAAAEPTIEVLVAALADDRPQPVQAARRVRGRSQSRLDCLGSIRTAPTIGTTAHPAANSAFSLG